MSETDKVFAGSIPENYDRYLVPLIFETFAQDIAHRAAALSPSSVLETAAGSGVVTRALTPRLAPDASYVVTDLNQPMLDYAATRQPADRRIRWRKADAQALPFEDAAFDIVCCQFGVMFFPDRQTGYREAKRVLNETRGEVRRRSFDLDGGATGGRQAIGVAQRDPAVPSPAVPDVALGLGHVGIRGPTPDQTAPARRRRRFVPRPRRRRPRAAAGPSRRRRRRRARPLRSRTAARRGPAVPRRATRRAWARGRAAGRRRRDRTRRSSRPPSGGARPPGRRGPARSQGAARRRPSAHESARNSGTPPPTAASGISSGRREHDPDVAARASVAFGKLHRHAEGRRRATVGQRGDDDGDGSADEVSRRVRRRLRAGRIPEGVRRSGPPGCRPGPGLARRSRRPSL